MGEVFEFSCGCKIPIINGKLELDRDNLNEHCPRTWELYRKGQTQSVFQLESFFAKNWTKELQPTCIKDAAALSAILRPGVLQSKDENNESMTRVFCKRKNNIVQYEKCGAFNESLSDTYSILIYQESLIDISKKLAGFSPKQSMKLVKGVGKKNAELLYSLEKEFVEGCIEVGIIGEEEARSIFSNIKASARYLFSLNHSWAYAEFGYETAWVKAHFPEQYICAWLRIAKNEAKSLEEIRAMISEARRLKILVKGPSARNFPKTDFFIEKGIVYFGVNSIKNCSDKSFNKLLEVEADWKNMNWVEFLVNYSHLLTKRQIVSMIKVGCFDSFSMKSRIALEYEYNEWALLTIVQKDKCRKVFDKNKHSDFAQFMSDAFKANPRVDKIKMALFAAQNPSFDLRESNTNIIENEKELLGINISCSKIDQVVNIEHSNKIKEVLEDNYDKNKVYYIVGEISDYRDFKIKTGKMVGQIMGSFKISDDSGETDVVCFPDSLDKFQSGLFDGNVIYLHAKKSNRGSGVVLEDLYEA